jgi:hypothetical protein
LKEELLSKEDTLTLLEKLVTEKETVIKNMAKFHNEMCMEILELKNNRNSAICQFDCGTTVVEKANQQKEELIKTL